MTSKQIEQQRDRVYRRMRSRRIHSMNDAARFVDTVGFCLLFASTQGIELPSLFEAVKGRRDAHIDDWDEDSDRVWAWKNDLPAERLSYYGKALAGGKPVLVSLTVLPYLCAVSRVEDVDEAYADGRVSLDAKRVHEALRSLGPTPTVALRAAAGFDRPEDGRRYHRALDELQRALVVAPVGATVETGVWSSQIFELVGRWYPRQIARAQQIDVAAARRALVRRYVATVVTANPAMIGRVFGWPREQIAETLDALVRQRSLVRTNEWVSLNGR